MKIHAALLVVLKDKKILTVVNRKYNTRGLPGGKREYYEEIDSCAVRELEEETGLVTLCQNLVPLTVPVMSGALNGHVVQVFFVKKTYGSPKTVEEGTDVAWMDPCYLYAESDWNWWFNSHLPIGMLRALPNTEFL